MPGMPGGGNDCGAIRLRGGGKGWWRGKMAVSKTAASWSLQGVRLGAGWEGGGVEGVHCGWGEAHAASCGCAGSGSGRDLMQWELS